MQIDTKVKLNMDMVLNIIESRGRDIDWMLDYIKKLFRRYTNVAMFVYEEEGVIIIELRCCDHTTANNIVEALENELDELTRSSIVNLSITRRELDSIKKGLYYLSCNKDTEEDTKEQCIELYNKLVDIHTKLK